MKYPQCQSENPEGSNFCLECGSKFSKHQTKIQSQIFYTIYCASHNNHETTEICN